MIDKKTATRIVGSLFVVCLSTEGEYLSNVQRLSFEIDVDGQHPWTLRRLYVRYVANDKGGAMFVMPCGSVLFWLSSGNVGPVSRVRNSPSQDFFVIGKLLGWCEVLRKSWMLLQN